MVHSARQVVQTKGIYHGLPTYPEDVKNLKAIVAGANGISGQHMLRVLSEEPERWTKIYALSRRPPTDREKWGKTVTFLSVDFLDSPEKIAETFRTNDVQADYVFFFAYLQPDPKPGQSLWSDAEGLCDVNGKSFAQETKDVHRFLIIQKGKLLSNTLEAFKLSSITPRRFCLQTGLKNYGVHLGPIHVPHIESAPRVTIEPNFYYIQEDLLSAYCRSTLTTYTITMPSFILGAVKDAALNLAYPIAVYASIQSHLHLPLVFPGDYPAWDKQQIQSSAVLNAYMAEWTVLTPEAEGKFNIGDSCPFTWSNFWPILAGWYGTGWEPPTADAEYQVMEMAHVPRGYGPKATIRYTYLLTEWATRPEVQIAWTELERKHRLKQSPFEKVETLFGFSQLALVMPLASDFSVSKSRELGWHGYIDSVESFLHVIRDLERLGMVPPMGG